MSTIRFIDINSRELPLDEGLELYPEVRELVMKANVSFDFLCEGERLKLINNHGSPVFIDIEAELNYHKKTFYKTSLKSQPLARALGLLKEKNIVIFDTTAGFLSDSLLMYAMGAKIVAFERNPLVQVLIQNALKVYPLENFDFLPIDVKTCQDFSSCDVIFFDPMYQEKNQKSLPKKEMQVFREFVGKDEDAKEAFTYLLQQEKRVVMKRSLKASPLGKASFTSSGKSTAYDVYLPL